MSNRLEQLLTFWLDGKDDLEWVLATIINTQGSSYRKAGAMMVINSLGQYQGMLSGGCLEPDLLRQARKCMDEQRNITVTYDSSDDDESAWQLGLGCGGIVTILLQPITQQNQYLLLDQLLQQLQNKQICFYQQDIKSDVPKNSLSHTSQLDNDISSANIIEHVFKPVPIMAIFGGGIDARPLATMAATLGWDCHIIEDRVAFAQSKYFDKATSIYKGDISDVDKQDWFALVDVIVIMTHKIDKDASALLIAQQTQAKYVGLLGPKHRTDKVFAKAQITEHQLSHPLSNPIGFDIGGELPESIALSIMAEAHAVLEGKTKLIQSSETLEQSSERSYVSVI